MSSFVYVLGDHEEGGTTNALASLDRGRLPAMVEAYCDGLNGSAESIARVRAEYGSGLAGVLAQSDVELAATDAPHPLGRGWGGLTLIVAKLV